jgi:hypothetical protein
MSDREALPRFYSKPSKFIWAVICASFLLALGASSAGYATTNTLDCRYMSQERERSAALILIGEVHRKFRPGSAKGSTSNGDWHSVIDDVAVIQVVKNELGSVPEGIHVISKEFYVPVIHDEPDIGDYFPALTSEGFVGPPLADNTVSLLVLKPVSEELRYNQYPVDYEVTFSKICSELNSPSPK